MSRQLVYDPIRTISIAAGYAALGAAFSHSATIVKVVNLSNQTIFISTDGVTDHDVVPSGGFYLYDITANSPPETGSIYEPKFTQIYAKGAGAGSVYLVVLYIPRVGQP
jgi:hypothetical protein